MVGAWTGVAGLHALGDEGAMGRNTSMSRAKLSALAVCLTAIAASGCSLTQPAQRDFTLVNQREAKAEETGNTLEAAEKACKEETEKKGIASVLGIVSRLRKGSADEAYIACMKARGYEVKP
jgi:hypothetical protein